VSAWRLPGFTRDDERRELENDVNKNTGGTGVEHRLVLHGKG